MRNASFIQPDQAYVSRGPLHLTGINQDHNQGHNLNNKSMRNSYFLRPDCAYMRCACVLINQCQNLSNQVMRNTSSLEPDHTYVGCGPLRLTGINQGPHLNIKFMRNTYFHEPDYAYIRYVPLSIKAKISATKLWKTPNPSNQTDHAYVRRGPLHLPSINQGHTFGSKSL